MSIRRPFWRSCLALPDPGQPAPAPRMLKGADWPTKAPKRVTLKALGLLPTKPDWATGFATVWTPGEAGARKRLDTFLATAVDGYAEHRNEPGVEGTSRLSPYLHFGEISPATCWDAALAHAGGRMTKGVETFLKELVWRGLERDVGEHMAAHVTALSACFKSADHKEGVASFLERRPAKFTGT
jgi:deoxyribodipyrimidine photo-lyase